jgi:choline-sulfatase
LRVPGLATFGWAIFGAWLVFAGPPLFAEPSSATGAKSADGVRPSIILVSVDTLRADRLGCYSPGTSNSRTPNIDKLCHGGTLWTHVSSLVPLTLPSHVSMLTSTYPFENGVEDNGDRLAPGAVTLAKTLRTHGYRTAAFLGSFVLDKRFGLDQGFDTYDSPSESRGGPTSDPGDIKRRGEEVANAGEEWLKTNSDRPFFLFLHIYDLHTPYNLSASEISKYGAGYDGELGYIDDVIGKLWDFLLSRRLTDKSIIVFASDHGEGLGDHGESTHGFFIYQSTLHVPLVIHWPARRPGQSAPSNSLPQARIDTPASLLDVAPTILDAARIPLPKGMEGRSLLATADTEDDVYSESVYPQKHFDASPLVSLRRGRFKYIDAPRPEFFDLVQDPGEANNLYAARISLATAYRDQLMELRRQHKPHSEASSALSPEAVERLHALGYLTGGASTPASAPSQADPKDRLADYELYGRAIQLASIDRIDEANMDLRGILERDPALLDVRLTLGLNEQRQGKDAEAIEQFRAVLTADPTSAIAHLDAGLSDYNLRKFEDAEKESNAALAISPGYVKAEALLAKTLGQKGEYERAATEFRAILRKLPDSYDAHDGLGTLAAMRGDWDESIKQLLEALAAEPAAAETRNTLGSVYLRKGEFAMARDQFEDALHLNPNYASAHYNLGLVFVRQKELDAARAEFRKALSIDPAFSPAREALVRLDTSP